MLPVVVVVIKTRLRSSSGRFILIFYITIRGGRDCGVDTIVMTVSAGCLSRKKVISTASTRRLPSKRNVISFPLCCTPFEVFVVFKSLR